MLHVNKEGKSKLQWDKVKDSGTRTAFGTGSQRDTQEGKGRYDLIPSSVLLRLAQHYENGAAKYGDNNWQKGQPLHQYYCSAIRHLEAIRNADLSEDHFSAVIWNVAAMIHHVDAMLEGTLPLELDSFGIVAAVNAVAGEAEIKEAFQDRSSVLFPSRSIWTPVTLSGALPEEPLPKAYDEDRFNGGIRRFRTIKLGEEE